MYNNKYILVYVLIFIGDRLLIGSWPTCWPDQENHMADHVIFRF